MNTSGDPRNLGDTDDNDAGVLQGSTTDFHAKLSPVFLEDNVGITCLLPFDRIYVIATLPTKLDGGDTNPALSQTFRFAFSVVSNLRVFVRQPANPLYDF